MVWPIMPLWLYNKIFSAHLQNQNSENPDYTINVRII